MAKPEFLYKALNRKGKAVDGSIAAASMEEARSSLLGLGYQILALEPQTPESTAHPIWPPLRSSGTKRNFPVALSLLCGFVLLGWAGVRSMRPSGLSPNSKAVREIEIRVECPVPAARLKSSDQIEFYFPEVPLKSVRPAREVLQQEQARLSLNIASRHRISKCVVRCRRIHFEKTVLLQSHDES